MGLLGFIQIFFMIDIAATSSPVPFFATRQLLSSVGLQADSDEILLALKIIFPFSNIGKQVSKLSLTDSMEAGGQLRFFLMD